MAAYINDIFKRERDHNTNWYDASDGTMERGDYILRNWRGDTAAVLTDGGNIVEYDKYSAYGTEFGIPGGDCDNDGDVDIDDAIIIFAWNNGPTQDARGDLNLDGVVNGSDLTLWTPLNGNTLGRSVLSLVGIRSGFAGYQLDPAISSMYHVRARKYSTELGRFLSRDPSGYNDGMNLYQYATSNPVLKVDPYGLDSSSGCSTCGTSGFSQDSSFASSGNGSCRNYVFMSASSTTQSSTSAMSNYWASTYGFTQGDPPDTCHPYPPKIKPDKISCEFWVRRALYVRGFKPSDPCYQKGVDAGAKCCRKGKSAKACLSEAINAIAKCRTRRFTNPPFRVCFSACTAAGNAQCAAGAANCYRANIIVFRTCAAVCLTAALAGGVAFGPCIAGCATGWVAAEAACFIAEVGCYAGVAAFCAAQCGVYAWF